MHELPYVAALGALTGNQAVQQVKAGLKAIYLSGWQVAGDANLGETTYPDQSLYPANSVPAVVRRINNALRRADQIQWAEGKNDTRLVRADRRRRRGGLRRAAERLRADAGDDRGRRRGRPLRGPARPRRRSAATSAARSLVPTGQFIRTLTAARLAADVARRADGADRAHRRAVGEAADVRHRPARPRVPHRRAHAPRASSTCATGSSR